MKYSLVIMIGGIGLLFVGIAGAAPIDVPPDEACNGHSDEIIGVLPGGEVRESEVSLYPGTSLNLVLCDGGNAVTTSAWSVRESAGLIGVAESEDGKSYTITVTGQRPNVSVAELVTEQPGVSGLEIGLQYDGIVEEEFANGSRVSFSSENMRTKFQQEKDEYLRTEERLNESLTEVQDLTQTLNETKAAPNESVLQDVNGSRNVLRDISTDWKELNSEHTTGVTRPLYHAAWENRESSGELRTLGRVLDRTNQTESDVTDELEQYLAALEETGRAAWNSVLVDVGIGLVPGMVIGGVLGIWYPRREAERVAYDRQYSAVDFDRRTILLPLVAGVVLGVATLVVLGLVAPQWFGYLWEVLV